MEPLSPNDPLLKLLGKAKPVQSRPNFVQNVVRAARQTPQERGLVGWLKAWLVRHDSRTFGFACAVAAAVAIAALVVFNLQNSGQPNAPEIAEQAPPAAVIEAPFLDNESSPLPEVETQWTNMDHVDALLAVQDTSELTDREIAFLLY